jgi:hypothetical protein
MRRLPLRCLVRIHCVVVISRNRDGHNLELIETSLRQRCHWTAAVRIGALRKHRPKCNSAWKSRPNAKLRSPSFSVNRVSTVFCQPCFACESTCASVGNPQPGRGHLKQRCELCLREQALWNRRVLRQLRSFHREQHCPSCGPLQLSARLVISGRQARRPSSEKDRREQRLCL